MVAATLRANSLTPDHGHIRLATAPAAGTHDLVMIGHGRCLFGYQLTNVLAVRRVIAQCQAGGSRDNLLQRVRKHTEVAPTGTIYPYGEGAHCVVLLLPVPAAGPMATRLPRSLP